MERIGEMFSNANVAVIVIVALLIGLFILVVWWRMRSIKKKRSQNSAFQAKKTESLKKAPPETVVDDGKKKKEAEEPAYGPGFPYKAMVFLNDGESIDFTGIPKPIGHIKQFDTSLPFSGGGYIVKELTDGSLVSYDPRDVALETDQLPDWAWFAINCRDIVLRFWRVPNPWWKSIGMWFAAAMILAVFICFLALFGG